MEPGEKGKKAKKKEKPREPPETTKEQKVDQKSDAPTVKTEQKDKPKSEESSKIETKSHEELKKYIGQQWTGHCKWFNVTRGFGFIVPDDKEDADVFVHQSELQMPGFRSLDEGEHVQFTVRVGKNGLEAEKVTGIEGDLKGSSIRPLGKKKENMIRCYKCGNLGYHVASKCKKEFDTAKVCYYCHKGDHLLADCPEYQEKKHAKSPEAVKPPKSPS